jgi:hypothetical protein
MSAKPIKSILFVCLGNICRSPLAEGVFRAVLAERGLDGEYTIDSAGTGGWHAGSARSALDRGRGPARRRHHGAEARKVVAGISSFRPDPRHGSVECR